MLYFEPDPQVLSAACSAAYLLQTEDSPELHILQKGQVSTCPVDMTYETVMYAATHGHYWIYMSQHYC